MLEYIITVVTTKIITTKYATMANSEDEAVANTKRLKPLSSHSDVSHKVVNIHKIGDLNDSPNGAD